jgi:hypothetical protein
MVAKRSSKPVKMNPQALKLGDVVEIRHSGGQRGRIIEFRGPLGPKSSYIYRVRLRRKPKAAYVELPEDQLEAVPVDRGAPTTPRSRTEG